MRSTTSSYFNILPDLTKIHLFHVFYIIETTYPKKSNPDYSVWVPSCNRYCHGDLRCQLISITETTFDTPLESFMEWPYPFVRPSTIAFERDILKTTGGIDFTFWFHLNTTKTWDAIDLGHSTKTKMAARAIWRLTLYPMQDIACEHDILKTACRIDFTFWYGLNTTKT